MRTIPNSKPDSQSDTSIQYEHSDIDPRRVAVLLVAMLVTLAAIVFSVWGVLHLLWDGGKPPRPPLTVTLPSMSPQGGKQQK